MSHRALPLQFLNLGGEMLYILDQRLRAQKITDDRAHKVRNDILCIMLSKCFVEELFHPQPLYSKSALRTVFHKLAHASIMKLNSPSMDKLFDLMLMSLKHQVVLAPQPGDLLQITLNHLGSMAGYATAAPVYEQVMVTRNYLLQIYSAMSIAEWFDIRRDLLMFVQDLHIRVSIFLKTGIQDHFGNLVIPTYGPVASGCEVPGTTRFFNSSGEVSLVTLFPNGGCYACAVDSADPAAFCADSRIKLGLNIYNDSDNQNNYEIYDRRFSEETAFQNFESEEKEDIESAISGVSVRAREELNLLAQLIGSASSGIENKEFKLSFFPSDENSYSEDNGDVEEDNVIRIEGRIKENPNLGKILGDLQLDEDKSSDPPVLDDLLELLDSA